MSIGVIILRQSVLRSPAIQGYRSSQKLSREALARFGSARIFISREHVVRGCGSGVPHGSTERSLLCCPCFLSFARCTGKPALTPCGSAKTYRRRAILNFCRFFF